VKRKMLNHKEHKGHKENVGGEMEEGKNTLIEVNPAIELKSLLHNFLLVLAMILVVAQAASLPFNELASLPLTGPALVLLSGKGAAQETIQWSGPAILHITARPGRKPFVVDLTSGADQQGLINTNGAVNDYRGYDFKTSGDANLSIQGDRAWTVSILPPDPHYFTSLKVPGKYQGNGSAVILIEGKFGVATFEKDRSLDLRAWAFGPGGVGKELYVNPDGDYKGKSVLPKGSGWIVVSASGPWSLEIQVPCCEVPAGGI
jgi:hypothetical protein